MSISTELERLQSARNTIRTKMVEFGLAASTDTLETLADSVEGIEYRGAVTAAVKEGETYAIPRGYHNGSGTVAGTAGGGNYTLQSKVATPTKKQQSITPDSGYYGLSDVTVKAIPENYHDVSSVTAAAADVLANKMIVSSTGALVTGTMPDLGAYNYKARQTDTSISIPQGYHNGNGKIGINITTGSGTPTKNGMTLFAPVGTSQTGDTFWKGFTINPIPDNFQDITGVTATAGKVLSGSKFVDSTGATVEGTMSNNGAINRTFDGITTTSVAIPGGYTSGGTVSLTSAIEEALAAI